MKVFLSWSGDRSARVARALRDWLPIVIQSLSPWLSSSDIQTGARWLNELNVQLAESKFGIICLTPENLSAPWILYEAGALAKSLQTAYVCPYLFGFSPEDMTGPLIQFQAVTATKEGTYALVKTLNRALGDVALDQGILYRIFDTFWPHLEHQLRSISEIGKEQQSRVTAITPEMAKLLDSVGGTPQPHVLNELLQAVVQQLSGSTGKGTTEPLPAPRERVFIVHGRNESIKEAVARFIERMGLAAIVLHEQPSEGKTIIEKFESNSIVDYAVVLLTGDDEGSVKDQREITSRSLRARQNVIFELGFFSARLGRSRVSVLYEDGVELPSDMSGILYIPIDSSGVWRFKLAQELKTAGLRIDLNKAL